ncbi:MAG: dienelactone hydrolase family protein [Deltaproteobacteria bacterium]|nr:dienelactone hydrolase family protein [Candidatus Anaeroferrophillus wilburensis]MBN2888569.1 dienelactone hydrolase family protein [Deltaproteobacteria bacterium]
MTKTTIIKKNVVIPAGEISIPGFFCRPETGGPFAAVIVFHGTDGFQPQHRELAATLAREGYAVLVPEWFGDQLPRRRSWDMLPPEDLAAMGGWIGAAEAVDDRHLALLGASRGGGLALYAGTVISGVRTVVNFFGLTCWHGGMDSFKQLPLNSDDHLDFLSRLPCPVISFHGNRDTVVPVENTYLLDNACRRLGIKHPYHIYPGVDHSFIWPGNRRYHPEARRDSWTRMLAFLKKQL